MTIRNRHRLITRFIAAIWLANGLLCKVLNLVPRHERIVSEILGGPFPRLLTSFIGIAEVVMAMWILSGIESRKNAVVQILVIATMNVLEFILVPDLLLLGRANIIFAFALIGVIFYNEFFLNKELLRQG